MPFFDRYLDDGERIVYRTRIHPAVFCWSFLFMIVSLVGFLSGVADLGEISSALAVIVTVYSLIAWLLSDFAVTNRRVLGRFFVGGIPHIREATLLELRTVEFKSGIVGRLFKYGTLVITDRQGVTHPFPMVRREFHRQLEARRARIQRILK
jgi:hypothetical protein